MSKQVLSIEQMKHLRELGLDTSNASMQYIENNNGTQMCIPKEISSYIKDVEDGYIICDAFTLQDIIDILPNSIEKCYIAIGKISVSYNNYRTLRVITTKMKRYLIDAAYSMLCWCIEKGYINTNKED